MTVMEQTRTRTRWVGAAFLLALMVAGPGAATTPGAVKAADSCTPGMPGLLFRTCREYPASLPITFVMDASGSKVPTADFLAAARTSLATWNQAWPMGGALKDGGTASSGIGRDGKNTIAWGNPASCGAPGAVAVACLWMAGSSGTAAHTIVEVDIVLNREETWRQANGLDLVAGTASGTIGVANGGWLDVQSVITHELGHALGLDDIGNQTTSWPFALSDAGQHTQTMYRWMYRGSTHARTLDVGDLAGVLFLWQKI